MKAAFASTFLLVRRLGSRDPHGQMCVKIGGARLVPLILRVILIVPMLMHFRPIL